MVNSGVKNGIKKLESKWMELEKCFPECECGSFRLLELTGGNIAPEIDFEGF